MIRIGVAVAAVAGGDQALVARAPPRGIPRPIHQWMGYFGAWYAARRAQRRAFSPSSYDQPKGEMMTITSSPSRRGVRRTQPTISNCCAPATILRRGPSCPKGSRLACNRFVPSCVRGFVGHLSRGVSQVARTHDVIAIERGPCPVACDLHGDPLADARALTMSRTAVCLKSCFHLLGTPALWHARRQVQLMLFRSFPRLGPRSAGKTWGMTLPSSCSKVRTVANCSARPALSSGMRYTRRPSPFLEPSGGNRRVPASRPTWLRVKGRTSSVKRHP
jgi:hypothetical protein